MSVKHCFAEEDTTLEEPTWNLDEFKRQMDAIQSRDYSELETTVAAVPPKKKKKSKGSKQSKKVKGNKASRTPGSRTPGYMNQVLILTCHDIDIV